jgi:hypothetical protein
MGSRRILYRLIWLAAALSLGHHLDHPIRHNTVGWWLEPSSRPGPARGVALGHDRVIGHMGTIATLPRPCEAPSRCDITSPGHLPADQDKAGRPRRPAIAAPPAGSGVVVTMR